MQAVTIQVRRKGTITLPRDLRRRYHLDEGNVFTLVDLGDGSFFLPPRVSEVAHLGDQVARIIDEEGISSDEILEALDAEREAYYQDRYVRD